MNDKIIECKICNSKMKEYESNNPQPLLDSFEDRVCRDCNDFVTASRLYLHGTKLDPHTIQHTFNVVAGIMQMAYSLKGSREQLMKEELK